MAIWSTIYQSLTRKEPCALITVADVQGSAPREAGARMVVLKNGSYAGTIGGGALEWKAIASAQAAIAATLASDQGPPVRHWRQALGPDLGQCCGGSVTLRLEVFEFDRLAELQPLVQAEAAGAFATENRNEDRRIVRTVLGVGQIASADLHQEQFGEPKHTLALFGAGHVGRALVLALASQNFKIVWIDPRANAFPPVIPGAVQIAGTADPVAELAGLPDNAFVLVMSHSHALDFDVISTALQARRFGYVGLIGSDSKRARFSKKLQQLGLADDDIGAMDCPIGIDGIKSKLPSSIAASVVADLLCRLERLEAKDADGKGDQSDLQDLYRREVSSR